MEKTDRAISLLETLVEIQLESQERDRKLFKMYTVTAFFVWTIFLLFILLLLKAFLF